jgi:hypothetical protein
MPRLALKPDSSFFRKIAMGAVGTRAVCEDLALQGHALIELERGSLDTKLWKDVKRKRVRIPDLVCQRCGIRVESRAKTKPELSMSHSVTDASRAWDFGMVDSDWVAFPVCAAATAQDWSNGRLGPESSYWHERNWVKWEAKPRINYFEVRTFRSIPFTKVATKGVTEGSETAVAWDAVFSTRTGTVVAREGQRLTVARDGDGHRHTRAIPPALGIYVEPGQPVTENQVIASKVTPITEAAQACPSVLPANHIANLLMSRERTQRFTGVKLARVRHEDEFCDLAAQLAADREEDVYIRLEAVSYLVSVGGRPARSSFAEYLYSTDDQTRLEAVIAVGESATPEAVEFLSELLDDHHMPYFLRSAAAWGLSRVGGEHAIARLVRAFADMDQSIREEALEGMIAIGGPALPLLLGGLKGVSSEIAAGCAEALRQQGTFSPEVVARIVTDVQRLPQAQWSVWLLGHLPREQVAPAIAGLQTQAPELHYAVTLLWTFVESWIAKHWELRPGFSFPGIDPAYEV